MKSSITHTIVLTFLIIPFITGAQDKSINPSFIGSGVYHGLTPPLRDVPRITDAEWRKMAENAEEKELNPELSNRSYPYAETALPKGPDPVWQKGAGSTRGSRAPIVNFNGQDSPYYPPDCNGTVGPNHYMQTINMVYAIYNKSGGLVAGPANMNTLFTGVTGSECNNGDPLILFDEQADRWLAVEFSLCGATDYMLVAVSTTNDPTGTWHKYSFDVADMPDYEKFGIWQDGYYMGTNNSGGNDIYVFQRSQMLIGGTAQMVGFSNPWRPTTIDGFMCVPPLDNDGAFAPSGEPGLFITINDDAIGGGSDQLWIYELAVNWVTPANSTFSRVQQLNVAAFDSNFGNDWTNIRQPGTAQELDAIPQVIMNPPQYRNFGTYETIVCCHTVDVDNHDHAGVRWYELRRPTSGTWSIRQQGTFAPDTNSRWMGSIMLNGSNQIGLGYSISSKAIYPGIRYCGQSQSAYAAGTGTMDIGEEVIQTGSNSQTGAERWGDYAALQIDPTDDSTFWFTTEYIGSGGTRKTKIASFALGPVVLTANFSAANLTPPPNTSVTLTDQSTGGPVSWLWSFSPNTVTYLGGTTSSSQNPQVSFNNSGYYTITLYVSDGSSNDTEIKTNYIHAYSPGLWTGLTSTDWNTASNWDGSALPGSSSNVVIPSSAARWPAFTGNFIIGTQCSNLTFSSSSEMNISGNFTINQGYSLNMTAGGLLTLGGNWINNGTFTPGTGTVKFNGTGPVSVSTTLSASDITAYVISGFSKGMTALSGATSGPTGDDGNSNVSIGFTFSYAGNNYTTLKISTNGWLSLNQTGTTGYSNADLFTSTAPNATIAAWWDDLSDDATSSVNYTTTGSAPNRVFTGEWNRVLTYYSGATARISFQIKLFETTNVIEFHYGTFEAGTHSGSESASIGIEDATGGSGHFKDVTTGSTITGVTNLVSTSNWPTANYRITPADQKLTFGNLVINNSGGQVNFIINTDVNGSFTVLPVGSFTVLSGKTLKVQGVAVY
jgi:PKD repeat protein